MTAGGTFSRIAVCVGEPEAAGEIIDLARRLGEHHGASVTLVHAVPSAGAFAGGHTPWSRHPSELEDELARDAESDLAGLARAGEKTVVLRGGLGPATLCAWAADAADLLVAAPHHGPAARIALGSFAGHLVHHAPCPLLLVRPGTAAP